MNENRVMAKVRSTHLELVLLEVLLGQVLKVSLGEGSGSGQDELGT
jgi:hypothetical protein